MRVKKKYGEIYLLPSAFSLTNFFFGFLSILMTFQGHFRWAAVWIIAAAIMDGLDGIMARSTHAQSEFGRELDSLADSVSFALGASLLLYFWGLHTAGQPGVFFAFLFAAAGILRLARYNVQTKTQPDRKGYTGLTVPSAAMFMSSLIIFHPQPLQVKEEGLALAILTVFISFCMVSTMPYRNYCYINPRRRIDLKTALALAIFIGGLLFYFKLFLLIFYSINVASGPVATILAALKKRRARNKVLRETSS